MKIWYSPYTLVAHSSLNSRFENRKKLGALLKVQFSKDLIGFADLHPHPELGDSQLSEHLDCIFRNEPSSLVNCCLHWALIDAHARKKGESLFKGLKLPRTHAIVTDLNRVNEYKIDELKQQGFDYLKIKMGRDIPVETMQLLQLTQKLQGLKLRLDFNEALDTRVFSDWWKLVKGGLEDHLDYIEDPYPYSPEGWTLSTAPLALDRSLNLENLKTFDGPVVVFKPAVSDTHWLNTIHHRVIFSTYMDHPLGEMSALFAAAQYYTDTGQQPEVCGLRTWHLFESNEFSESLDDKGSVLSVAGGTGLGFDEQLKSQNWKLLS